MIDTHCHLTYDGLAERVEEVLAAARAAGVGRVVSIGTSLADSAAAIELAGHRREVSATVGLHPHHAEQMVDGEAFAQEMRSLARREGVVALGEMGLDQHYDEPSLAVQRRAFEVQLGVAAELGSLPIVIHNREATDETLAMVRASGISPERFVFHCFTGTAEEIVKIVDFGAWVGFTGIVTFKSGRGVAAASDLVPLERLLVETDSPYLTPEPYRKIRPNEPRYVVEVARFLAERRGMGFEAFVGVVDGNAERFYGLG
ncbi:TatD family hydrolase [Mucisphaera calidilacus]|uniref:Putative deoxyribonuclease YcfH n=1 Tax=Mucisphaera calidilacus TaxID=2527982 RepID=A0A518BYS6_9BACT|nr:TatD family hydrolase [Mucisphaera calidilacus]QDU72116.1 putative deoxyribonuclease YcfH [Mucisphaera calidilacus]